MTNPLIAPDLHDLAASFRRNAEHALGGSSPFYQKLARRVAEDPALLALAAHAQPHQPPMNLLFGAVHYVLLRGVDDDAPSRISRETGIVRDGASPMRNFFHDPAHNPNRQDDCFFSQLCIESGGRERARTILRAAARVGRETGVV